MSQMAICFPETSELDWIEFYSNGGTWIAGKIKIIEDSEKHLFNFRTGFKGLEGEAVCRIGEWIKFFDNGQLAWTIDYGDGKHGYKSPNIYPSYRKDGTIINH